MAELTQRQEAFALAYVETGNASEAYRRAYPRSRNWKPETVYSKASHLLSHGKVQKRVDELRQELAARNLWRREQSVKALIRVIEAPDRQADVIAAVRELNVMHGYNAPEKIEVSGPDGQAIPTRLVIDWGDEQA